MFVKPMRYRDDYDDDDNFVRREPGHSVFGIVSFLLVMAVGLLEFCVLVVAGVMSESSPELLDDDSPVSIVLGLGLIGGLALNVVGIALGIAGLCQPRRNKVFAGLGVGIGACLFVGVLLILVLGLLMG